MPGDYPLKFNFAVPDERVEVVAVCTDGPAGQRHRGGDRPGGRAGRTVAARDPADRGELTLSGPITIGSRPSGLRDSPPSTPAA